MTARRQGPVAAFVALCVACVIASGAYVVHATSRSAAPPSTAAQPDSQPDSQPDPLSVTAVARGPHVLFRNMTEGTGGRLGMAPLDRPEGSRALSGLNCDRLHFAAGQGLCLTERGGLLEPYQAVFFGPDLEPRRSRPLAGVVSRARVSPDGRYGAATVFVTGDSYTEEGGFSTRTTVYDMAAGTALGDLEQFAVTRHDRRIEAVDFNFWGVTFAAGGTFYATLGTAGHRYLVRGDVARRTMEVLRDGVECPSLSPDGTRIAFKARTGDEEPIRWRPAVLDLATLRDHVLPETRNVDDQLEWLDDSTVLYGVDDGFGPPDIWAAPADGTGPARLFLPDGDSPAVIRK